MDEAAALVRAAQSSGGVVVLCHGCFDIVHPGHIRHLQQARKLGDRLLVTVTRDGNIGKGDGRPLIPHELRAENLAALDCVDWVAVSEHSTAVELLGRIRPDVYVKGREYEQNRDPRFQEEKQAVQEYGGRVVFTSGDIVFSSTALISALEETANTAHAALKRLIQRHQLSGSVVESLIHGFRRKRVLVVGETIIDTYVLCDRPDVAGEGPLMTLRPIEYRSFDGGAAIIARHIAAMGARPVLLTAMPRSLEAESVRQRIEAEGVEVHKLDVDRSLVEKQRYLVGTSKVMKLDLGEPLVLDAAHQKRLIALAADLARSCDAMIIADFGLGLFTAPVLRDLCSEVRPVVDLLAGDVSGRRSNLLALRQLDLLCPSEIEIRDALHDYEEGLTAVVWQMLDHTRSQAAIVTLGDEGLISFDRRGEPDDSSGDWFSRLHAEPVPPLAPHAVDQLGCGDALLAAATLTLVGGGSVALAGVVGSLAAAAEAQKLGNTVIAASDLRRGLQRILAMRLTFDPEPAPCVVLHRHDQLPAAHTGSS